MRNDFYVGIFEDNYLAHGAKGWTKKNHKYTARFWKNGRWYYVYQEMKNAMLSNYHKNAAYLQKKFADKAGNMVKSYAENDWKQRNEWKKKEDKYYSSKLGSLLKKELDKDPNHIAFEKKWKNAEKEADRNYDLAGKILGKHKTSAYDHLKKAEHYGRKSAEANMEWRKRTKGNSKKKAKRINKTNKRVNKFKKYLSIADLQRLGKKMGIDKIEKLFDQSVKRINS